MREGRFLQEENSVWYKGKPVMREWELNENSTRYDAITAGPSDEDLMKYWWTWAAVALIVGIASLMLFLGIALSPKARENPFNLYLLYLSIPDFVFSLCCGITCLLNAINGEYWSAWMCTFQQWYCVFGIGSNAWLNAIIASELYKMLRFGHNRRRYTIPTRLYVTQQALMVFLFMGFLGTWCAIEAPHWPIHAGAPSGLACLPIEVDHASSRFFWLVFFPLFAGIPSVCIIFFTYQILRRKLLPPSGKRRLLAIYFGRLILVFYVMWLPTLILLFVFASYVPSWGHFLGGLWSHLQGAVSVAVALMKPDIFSAVVHMLTCQCDKERHSTRQVASQGTHGASNEVSAPKGPSQHFFGSNHPNLHCSTEVDKHGEKEPASGRGRSSMFSSRDMWPSTNQLVPTYSRSQLQVTSEHLVHVEEQVRAIDDSKEVQNDKDKLPDETDDDESPLSSVIWEA